MTDRTVPLVVGVGNEERGDDGCGLAVVRSLGRELGPRCRIAECSGDLTELIELWEATDTVYLVDAVRTGGAPGTVHRIEVGAAPLDARPAAASTHGISLGQVVELARALHRLPRRLFLYGIDVAEVGVGAGLSAPVRRAVDETARRIAEELGSETRAPSGEGVAARA